jgi:hypothetical protein
VRAYDVERRVLSTWFGCALDLEGCQALADTLCEHFGVEPIEVHPGRADARRSMFYYPSWQNPRGGWGAGRRPHIMLSPRYGHDVATVCHEVAHYIAFTRGVKGHGRTWAAIYCLVVEHACGSVADELRDAFREVGLLSPRVGVSA